MVFIKYTAKRKVKKESACSLTFKRRFIMAASTEGLKWSSKQKAATDTAFPRMVVTNPCGSVFTRALPFKG